jgi:hypothetical protein
MAYGDEDWQAWFDHEAEIRLEPEEYDDDTVELGKDEPEKSE